MLGTDEHIIEAIGKTKIHIRNGHVVEVENPLIQSCPLARRFSMPVFDMNQAAIKANIEQRIKEFGMCTENRQLLSNQDFVMFGASELMSCGLRQGIIDCAVLVCDGAGTLFTSNPLLVQGIGGRMSGLIKTSPIPPLIQKIEGYGGTVLSPSTGVIDQVQGVALAHKRGYRNISVTIVSFDDAVKIRREFPETLIFGVHLTGISDEEAENLGKVCDIIAACASSSVRKVVGKIALIQAGTTVPVFALTIKGKSLIIGKLTETNAQLLVKNERLPFLSQEGPNPLI